MNKKEKIRFTRELCNAIRDRIIEDIKAERVPEEWDGIELRMLVHNRADTERYPLAEKSRRKRFQNTLFVKNLQGGSNDHPTPKKGIYHSHERECQRSNQLDQHTGGKMTGVIRYTHHDLRKWADAHEYGTEPPPEGVDPTLAPELMETIREIWKYPGLLQSISGTTDGTPLVYKIRTIIEKAGG